MPITKPKLSYIRSRYLAGNVDPMGLAKKLGLKLHTIQYYIKKLKIIEANYPELNDVELFISKIGIANESIRYKKLIALLPELLADEPGPAINGSKIYRKYKLICPGEYSHVRFLYIFSKWFEKNKAKLIAEKLKSKFTAQELEIFREWRNSNDHKKWQMAVVMESVYTYHTLVKVGEKVECTQKTLRTWLKGYKTGGIDGLRKFCREERPISEERALHIKTKMDNLVHLVQQSPKLYGIDKPSWMIIDLVEVFKKEYNQVITKGTVSNYLKKRGIRYKKSREVMSSPDLLFNEKFEAIQKILENLGPKEKFFSIDEYGPCAVKPKPGMVLSMPSERPSYSHVFKSKGWFICTCALELSTNQITHFYSLTKETPEMIKLIDVLLIQYKDQEKLYLSWDAASWHSSKKLMAYLEIINSVEYRADNQTPLVVLAPLPSCAQYLNVIESVFSGMSKSVIRNSDYESVDECKGAIDRYFEKRNKYFLDNPKRAGRKIWGKEKVEPVFVKANICK